MAVPIPLDVPLDVPVASTTLAVHAQGCGLNMGKRHGHTLGYTATKLHLHHAGLVQAAAKRSAHRKGNLHSACVVGSIWE